MYTMKVEVVNSTWFTQTSVCPLRRMACCKMSEIFLMYHKSQPEEKDNKKKKKPKQINKLVLCFDCPNAISTVLVSCTYTLNC